MHMHLRKPLVVAASSLAALTLVAVPAFADSHKINFEPPTYHIGSIAGQDGWSAAVNPLYDQAVVANTAAAPAPRGFGTQSFRMSNAVTSSSFGDWVFAKPLVDPAGESTATAGAFPGGTRQTRFNVQWTFASTVPNAQQLGLRLAVSPDRGDGARMSFIRLVDNADGLGVDFIDVQGTSNPANFVETHVATGLDRTKSHTVRLNMRFVDGPSNDVVKVFVDGKLVHTGTSWENYYRYDSEASAEQSPRLVRTVLFRASGSDTLASLGKGFLFDDLTLTSRTPRDNDSENENDDD